MNIKKDQSWGISMIKSLKTIKKINNEKIY